MCVIFASTLRAAAAAIVLIGGILMSIPAAAQQCVTPPSGLVSWWPGDGNADDIEDGNPGTLVSGATFDSGRVDQAFRFTGSLNSGVRIPSSASLNPADAITLDAWVFPFSFPNAAPSVLRKQGSSPTINNQYLMAVGDGLTRGVAHCNIGDFANPVGGSVPLNQWTHVACTYDRQFARLYVNGVEVVAQPRTQPIPASPRDLWIGNWEFQSIRQFDGLIDEVEIFNRALTPSEIQAIFAAGSAGKCKPGATEPNLVVDKSDSPDPVLAGDKLIYTVDVDNIGTAEATGVTLIDTLPAEVTFVSASPSQGTCNESSGTVTCDLGTLASAASASVEITVTTTTPGTISNTAEVTGNPPDSDETNNTDTEDTTVSAVTCDGLPATRVGTPGNDVINGTSGADVIHGLSGDDTISGGNGDDRICGGNDNDTINGGNGIDRLFGDSGADTLNGDNGDDALDGGADTDTCNGGNGSDTAAGCEAVTSVP